MTCIHCEAVDLPNLKEEQGMPEPYFLFDSPYMLQIQAPFRKVTLCFILFT